MAIKFFAFFFPTISTFGCFWSQWPTSLAVTSGCPTMRCGRLPSRSDVNIVFFNNLKKTEALQKINFSSSEKLSLHTNLMKLRPAQLSKKAIVQALKKCFLHTNLMKLRPAQLGKKTTFQALKNCFCTLTLWDSDQPSFAKKNQALKKCFFCTLTLWNSDQPSFAKKQLFRL